MVPRVLDSSLQKQEASDEFSLNVAKKVKIKQNSQISKSMIIHAAAPPACIVW